MSNAPDQFPQSILKDLDWQEDSDREFKLAEGGCPKSLWSTYSAMANTDGGTILLGVNDHGQPVGLADPAKVQKELWDMVNNPQKVSTNVLRNDDVVRVDAGGGRPIIAVRVRRAGRRERPVYTGTNPLTGTYRRNFEGDYRCTEDEVGRMLADRSTQPADSQILTGFSMADLDTASLQQYRQRFASMKPTHPWLDKSETEFLRSLGAWRTDRASGEEGLTLAGLLAFGKDGPIRDAVPEYHIDYREVDTSNVEARWTDRITADGTWEPNLFQFFSRVIQRLSADLKLPFELGDDLFRQGETIVHVAIREALVNALIHADYRGQGGVLIEKRADRLVFSNPGSLLLSVEQILKGGLSECRNKSLQTIFFLMGAAEKAGSGIDKIRKGWQSQHWFYPSIQEQWQPDRVKLDLPMVSLLPAESTTRLERLFGPPFKTLNEHEVHALVLADLESEVTNSRLRQMTDQHAFDLTKMLQGLVSRGFLAQLGQGRWTRYRLSKSTDDSSHSEDDSSHNGKDLSHKTWDSSQMLHELPEADKAGLEAIGQPSRASGRLSPEKTRKIIHKLCQGRYLTAAHLAELMGRSAASLRARFLKAMVDQGSLRLQHPDKPNRPDQAYTATEVEPDHAD